MLPTAEHEELPTGFRAAGMAIDDYYDCAYHDCAESVPEPAYGRRGIGSVLPAFAYCRWNGRMITRGVTPTIARTTCFGSRAAIARSKASPVRPERGRAGWSKVGCIAAADSSKGSQAIAHSRTEATGTSPSLSIVAFAGVKSSTRP